MTLYWQHFDEKAISLVRQVDSVIERDGSSSSASGLFACCLGIHEVNDAKIRIVR
jgi:hypothetical protein